MNSVWGEKMLYRSHRNSLASQRYLEKSETSQESAEGYDPCQPGDPKEMHEVRLYVLFFLSDLSHCITVPQGFG